MVAVVAVVVVIIEGAARTRWPNTSRSIIVEDRDLCVGWVGGR